VFSSACIVADDIQEDHCGSGVALRLAASTEGLSSVAGEGLVLELSSRAAFGVWGSEGGIVIEREAGLGHP
jgi:hypothetical protein